ncbi:fungal-specific transcription factor domain-containing protein [Cryomyces antarcticus]
MPGILPMKVIKVGSNAQSRIAQACDRCRSKKIRCDGIRPCCSQCANVGFECKTSDKLSRRAFPRGYTESLEERVRLLEGEVRELKDLLDEKDEKIDVLSRIHSHSSQPLQLPSPRRGSTTLSHGSVSESKEELQQAKDDLFRVQQSPFLLDGENTDSYFMGTSSGRAFIDAFKRKVQESGRAPDIDTDIFFNSDRNGSASPRMIMARPVVWTAPPRLVSDQMINIFFQEWAPLFPVLHRPTFLSLYGEYVASSEEMEDEASVAQLNLVFGIAALSSNSQTTRDIESFESQWHAALDSVMMENSLVTLQCLILAMIHCIQKADYTRLLNYKGLAVGLSYRLGLHQSQKRFALGTLTCETRKKVFWSLYTLDCFSAALLGLPKHLKEEDVHCEYPVDADDEYVTDRGFQPTLPGESTKLSSALALFRASRILSKVLEQNYPASTSHEISFRDLAALSDELDAWSNTLASHLRMQFVQDKPSTGTISSRSPLLSLTYHYIRCLIHRPAVCASLGSKSSSSLMAMAASCKHIIQIVQLLEERSMSFSFCLNKNELLVLSGFGILFQGIDLKQEGKMMKDGQKMTSAVVGILERSSPSAAVEFGRIANALLPSGENAKPKMPAFSRHNSDGVMPAPQDTPSSTRKQLKAIASRFSAATIKYVRPEPKDNRRATVPNLVLPEFGQRTQSQLSVSSIRSDPSHMARSEPAMSPSYGQHRAPIAPAQKSKRSSASMMTPNLDYLSFSNAPTPSQYPPVNTKIECQPTDWERLLASIDNGQTNIYDNIYGGPAVEAIMDVPPLASSADAHLAWSPGIWTLCSGDATGAGNCAAQSESVLSFSDESFTSGEDFSAADWGSSTSANGSDAYRGIMMPELGDPSGGGPGMGGLDATFGL